MEAAAAPAPPTAAYPVRYDVEYKERLSRPSTIFRLLLVIPQILVLYVLELIVLVLLVISWFAILFTRTYPRGVFNLMVQIYRWYSNVLAYMLLLRDEYPPFSGSPGKYPLTVEIDYPEEGLSRWKIFVKWWLLAIPHLLIVYALLIVAEVMVFVAWFAIVFTGRFPRGLFDFVVGALRWATRVSAYAFLLTTDRYPPFAMK